MPDYQNAKIYKIINDEMPDKVYYGSTCNTFAKRLSSHKTKSESSRRCTSKVLFEYGNPQMILVEKYPCNDKLELTQRERFYIENNECINRIVPNRTHKEYYDDNKEMLLSKRKEYYKNNKEKEKQYREANKEKSKQYREKRKIATNLKHSTKIECKCGGKYTYSHKPRHMKTKKHLKYIQTL
tara:strand:+ start:274 stop:822 length:549 start_codon:yes stop_codon:yes gene_type:complete